MARMAAALFIRVQIRRVWIFMLREFLFPSTCLHCRSAIENATRFLCEECAELLPWIDIASRCPRCFFPVCECARMRWPLYRRLAVFSYGGPAETLIHKYKFQNLLQLTDLFASCLLLQIEKAELKWPDLIVPIPHARWHSLLCSYNSSEHLASALSKKMSIPCEKILKRTFLSIPQRGKSKVQREALSKHEYRLRKKADVADRCILLIDDIMATGTTVARCAEVLKEGYAAQVSACSLGLVE
jgi:ComF family protein